MSDFVIFYDDIENNDEWTKVESKKKNKNRSKKNNANTTEQKKLELDDVIEKLKYLEKYSPRAVFLYGSTAKKINRPSSDVDLMIIWNKTEPENIIDIKIELEELFSRKVDLVSMIAGTKFVEYTHESTKCFIECVMFEAIPIIGNESDIFLIQTSTLIGKVKLSRRN